MVQHVRRTMEDQVGGVACLKHCGHGCKIATPDLGVFGTPCNPFSFQRTSRSKAGNVESHRLYDVTFADSDWLVKFEPPTVIMEQAEGFAAPLSCDDPETPLEKLPGFKSATSH